MRYTDLVGTTVYGSDGERIGRVRDVGFEGRRLADGRMEFRVCRLECGDSLAVGHRFGYGKGDMAGPWPLGQILSRLGRRRTVIVDWAEIAGIRSDRIDLRRTRHELDHESDRK